MPRSKVLKRRGVTVFIQAHGEVLFTPGVGMIPRWHNRFSHIVRHEVIQAAPSNKRPRWAHFGKPLKGTIRATTTTVRGMRTYSAVGSTAPYALFVDQGSGVYAGRSPWPAKILPPWKAGGYPLLYESTWVPGGHRTVKPVMISGQRGQKFFDKGMRDGLRRMGLMAPEGPDLPSVRETFALEPATLVGPFQTNYNQSNPAFVAQLAEWRAERDRLWRNAGSFTETGWQGVMRRAREQRGESQARAETSGGPKVVRRSPAKQSAPTKTRSAPEKKTSPPKKRVVDRPRAATPAAVAAARKRLMILFQREGFVVQILRVRNDGTYMAYLVPKGGGRAVARKGRW